MTKIKGAQILQNAAAADGNGELLHIESFDSVAIQISGTFNANVYFEATLDGSNWVEVAAIDLNSTGGTKAKSHGSPGLFHVDKLGGCLLFRARVGSYSSGAVTVKANAHTG